MGWAAALWYRCLARIVAKISVSDTGGLAKIRERTESSLGPSLILTEQPYFFAVSLVKVAAEPSNNKSQRRRISEAAQDSMYTNFTFHSTQAPACMWVDMPSTRPSDDGAREFEGIWDRCLASQMYTSYRHTDFATIGDQGIRDDRLLGDLLAKDAQDPDETEARGTPQGDNTAV